MQHELVSSKLWVRNLIPDVPICSSVVWRIFNIAFHSVSVTYWVPKEPTQSFDRLTCEARLNQFAWEPLPTRAIEDGTLHPQLLFARLFVMSVRNAVVTPRQLRHIAETLEVLFSLQGFTLSFHFLLEIQRACLAAEDFNNQSSSSWFSQLHARDFYNPGTRFWTSVEVVFTVDQPQSICGGLRGA